MSNPLSLSHFLSLSLSLSLYIYIYASFKHIFLIKFLIKPVFFFTDLNGFMYRSIKVTIWDQSFVCTNSLFFNPLIGPDQVLPLRVRVERGATVITGYITFPKSPRLELCHPIVYYNIQDTRWGFYTSADIQPVFLTAPPDWVVMHMKEESEQLKNKGKRRLVLMAGQLISCCPMRWG